MSDKFMKEIEEFGAMINELSMREFIEFELNELKIEEDKILKRLEHVNNLKEANAIFLTSCSLLGHIALEKPHSAYAEARELNNEHLTLLDRLTEITQKRERLNTLMSKLTHNPHKENLEVIQDMKNTNCTLPKTDCELISPIIRRIWNYRDVIAQQELYSACLMSLRELEITIKSCPEYKYEIVVYKRTKDLEKGVFNILLKKRSCANYYATIQHESFDISDKEQVEMIEKIMKWFRSHEENKKASNREQLAFEIIDALDKMNKT